MSKRLPDTGSIRRDEDGRNYHSPAPMVCTGYEKLTVSNVATKLQQIAANAQADSVFLRVETNDIRWRADGVDPTATDGMLMKTTDLLPLSMISVGIEQLASYRFIRAGGADGTLHVLYFQTRG